MRVVHGTDTQIVTSLGIHVGEDVAVDLRGSLERTAFLTIGHGIEIVLGEAHLRVLRDQATVALGDIALVSAADEAVSATYQAGAQARTAAAFAMAEAETAGRAGAEAQADAARAAAVQADRAAECAQAAVRAAAEVMEMADDAAERARDAAQAARAATRAAVPPPA